MGGLEWWYCYSKLRAPQEPSYPREAGIGFSTGAASICNIKCCHDAYCPYWDEIGFQPIDKLLAAVASTFRKPFIVDMSKGLFWYQWLLPRGQPTSAFFILLHKAPHAWYSSAARNIARGGGSVAEMPLRLFLTCVDIYCEYYRRARALLLENPRIPCISVPYESLLTDTQGTLGDILEWLGLPWDPHVLQWHLADHHLIGGNGPLKYKYERGLVEGTRRSDYLDEMPMEARAFLHGRPEIQQLLPFLGRNPDGSAIARTTRL
ncbi:MAG: sulfotransferase [Deltaproteobacteria bacterium]|nr:sulfotransferase [Deltaproteobacteria bacterium]